VSFEIGEIDLNFGACHCKMCQRWAGSALLGLTVPKDQVTFKGAEHIKTRATSAWAERAWCDDCGSGLWYRVTAPGPYEGTFHMPIGLLDDPSGLKLTSEIYIDRKPDAYSFANTTKTMTEAEAVALFGSDENEG
jgi:hypothetical protein